MVERIAVFRIGQLGDALVSIPAIRAIRKAYPSASLMLITEQCIGPGLVSPSQVFEVCEIFSEIVTYVSTRPAWRNWVELMKLVTAIRRFRADVLFYLAPFPRSFQQLHRDRLFFQRVCGIPYCYGIKHTMHLHGERDHDGQLSRLPSEVDRLLAIVGETGIAVPQPGQAQCDLPISLTVRNKINELWEEAGFNPATPVIAVGPGSKMPAKRWPLDRFMLLGEQLFESLADTRVLIVGGQEDHELGQRLYEVLGRRVVNWAGRLSILECAEALRRCVFYVGNDTGTMHLAAAMGTRCIAIFSSRDHPGKWEPYGEEHIVLRKDVPCAGCLLRVCEQRGMMCLIGISVDEVFNACLQVLNINHITAVAEPFPVH